jgi:hypothetical protein
MKGRNTYRLNGTLTDTILGLKNVGISELQDEGRIDNMKEIGFVSMVSECEIEYRERLI